MNLRKNTIIPIEISARHIHLSQKDLEELFGIGYKLKKFRELSQFGEFRYVFTVLSFILNRHWTFQKKLGVDFLEIVRFYATILSGLAINLAALAALVELFSLYDIIAVAVSLFLTAAWNFLLMKFWVFPSAKRPIEEEATADRIR